MRSLKIDTCNFDGVHESRCSNELDIPWIVERVNSHGKLLRNILGK